MRLVLALTVLATAAWAAEVPFVGCPSDGQTGPLEIPKGSRKRVDIPAADAGQLAYYQSGVSKVGVLAPRGWHCFAVYGSGGDYLAVSPNYLKGYAPLDGHVIGVSQTFSETSGRFHVADTIMRAFPAHKTFVDGIREASETVEIAAGPYPNDRIVPRGKSVVDYMTPSRMEGLGTGGWVDKGGLPIEGTVVLAENFDLFQLAVRLPESQRGLIASIRWQFEKDAPAPAK